MKSTAKLAFLLAMAIAMAAGSANAQTKEVTIAHQDMIVPFRVLQAAGAVEKATGYKISWKMFGGGGDVIKAMASGQVPIGEVGSSPITAAAAQGIDIQVIWVLDDINNAEQLVASTKSGITSLAGLKGKKVATPFVSTAHYQLLFALNKAGVNPKEIQILNLRPPEIAAAWERGDLDATFIWEPVLSKVRADGKVIMSSADIAKQGAPTFDGIMVNRAWAAENKDFLTRLLKALADADKDYKANPAKYGKGSDTPPRSPRSSAPSPTTSPACSPTTPIRPRRSRPPTRGLAAAPRVASPRRWRIPPSFLMEQGGSPRCRPTSASSSIPSSPPRRSRSPA